jgi:membrane-anchored protein YejM (alkaline phosphatase superfamily)
MPENQGRRKIFRWLGWFMMANAVVFGLIGLRYLGAASVPDTPLAWIYLLTIYTSSTIRTHRRL